MIRVSHTRVRRRYMGGALLSNFTCDESIDSLYPESWIGSDTLAKDGGVSGVEGLSLLESGELLRDAILVRPEYWLGQAHLNSFGAHTGLLVKLLDSAQRLPIHAHPSTAFADQYLPGTCGKTEAWIVLDIREGARANAWIGMREDVDASLFRLWLQEQDIESMFAAMNRVQLNVGDVVYLPAGIPHTFDSGVLVAEVQEPSDHSLHLEWKGYPERSVDQRTMGLGWDIALRSLNLDAYEVQSSLPAEASLFFAFDQLVNHEGLATTGNRFSIWIVVKGNGTCNGESVRLGDCWVTPAASDGVELAGAMSVLRFLRPL